MCAPSPAPKLVELELELLDLAVRLLEVLVEAVALGDQVLLCEVGRARRVSVDDLAVRFS